jgi:hypothetical protein
VVRFDKSAASEKRSGHCDYVLRVSRWHAVQNDGRCQSLKTIITRQHREDRKPDLALEEVWFAAQKSQCAGQPAGSNVNLCDVKVRGFGSQQVVGLSWSLAVTR